MGNCVMCECIEYQHQLSHHMPINITLPTDDSTASPPLSPLPPSRRAHRRIPINITLHTEDDTASPPISPLPSRLLQKSSTRAYLPFMRFKQASKSKRSNFKDVIADRAQHSESIYSESIYAFSDWDLVEQIHEKKGKIAARKRNASRRNRNEELNRISQVREKNDLTCRRR